MRGFTTHPSLLVLTPSQVGSSTSQGKEKAVTIYKAPVLSGTVLCFVQL